MIAICIMVNGIAHSGVVQNVSKLTCTIFYLKLIASNQGSPFKSRTCSIVFADFGYFLCVKKSCQYLYRNTYHKLCK